MLEVPGCDWAAGLLAEPPGGRAAWRARAWETTLDWLRREHAARPVDLFLGYLYPEQIEPAAVRSVRALGIPCVNFFCDNVREFRRVPREFSGFDLHWVPEYAALPLYRRAGLPHLHAPMPCWVPPELRTPPARETFPVTFIGTRDELRERLFAEAFALGLEARLWGRGWRDEPATPSAATPAAGSLLSNQFDFARRHGLAALARKLAARAFPPPPFSFDFSPFAEASAPAAQFFTLTREATVCLGVNRYPSPRHSPLRPAAYSRLRDLEAPMVGACYLTEWCEGLDQLYAPGVEIETYRDAAELVEKTRALSADPARRARLRAAGQHRALSDHTIARTIERVARTLQID